MATSLTTTGKNLDERKIILDISVQIFKMCYLVERKKDLDFTLLAKR